MNKNNFLLLLFLMGFSNVHFSQNSIKALVSKEKLANSLNMEDGHDLWLRYVKVQDPDLLTQYLEHLTQIVVTGNNPTTNLTREELQRGLSGLLGKEVPIANSVTSDGTVLVSVLDDYSLKEMATVKGDGYILLTKKINGKTTTVIGAKTTLGALYGAFGLLRIIQTEQSIDNLNIVSNPKIQYRMLNHWDNTSNRGRYFGNSINLSKWDELPDILDPIYMDYARANASIGINGTVLNNFTSDLLRTEDLKKISALAKIYRPYGIQIYLSINFASPLTQKEGGIGNLNTADPQDPRVAKWWKDKADEIYATIPDFGGFLVKADSEGMPGPKQYGRNHAEAANMLAAALKPHGGLLIWRAFVYEQDMDPDRAKRSYMHFKPLDGKFDSNVIVQVKNGPMDFQPDEPFHPLFGAMKKTPLMMEFQAMQEYLGRATDLVYLGEQWAEVLKSDTHAKGKGSTVARVIDGSLNGHSITGMAAVANIGNDRNWTSHPFAQANWYALGRLGWNPDLNADTIAKDWAKMTWGNDPELVDTITKMMKGSWEATINVRSPLGLNFVCARDHHNPNPEGRVNDYWYADKNGIGYNRTDHAEKGWNETSNNENKIGYERKDVAGKDWKETGSNYAGQYHEPLRTIFNDMEQCPEEYLLWFHFVPWDYKMKSERTLWEELCYKYESGYDYAKTLQKDWKSLEGQVDAEREAHHKLWRDTCINFFAKVNGLEVPSFVKDLPSH